MILAGDVGGTKCNLALFEIHGQDYRKIVHRRYESREFSSFDRIIAEFLSQTSSETKNAGASKIAAAFGLPHRMRVASTLQSQTGVGLKA